MADTIKIKIDGKEIVTTKGKTILDAATDNGVYIPTLCHFAGATPKGACRVCTVKVNNRYMTSCSTPATDGMTINNNVDEIADFRKSIVELLFVSGNHFCPACEKSGNCELQALAYRFGMLVPRFPFAFPKREVDASSSKIIKEQNRCVFCKRCIKTIKDKDGKRYFAFNKRGNELKVILDEQMGNAISDKLAKQAMDNCPVGSIIYKGRGFSEPIGSRKFDKEPIGNTIEK